MAFVATTDHPLGWGDDEIVWLLKCGLKPTHIYKAMGYKGRVPTDAFKRRLERLRKEVQ